MSYKYTLSCVSEPLHKHVKSLSNRIDWNRTGDPCKHKTPPRAVKPVTFDANGEMGFVGQMYTLNLVSPFTALICRISASLLSDPVSMSQTISLSDSMFSTH